VNRHASKIRLSQIVLGEAQEVKGMRIMQRDDEALVSRRYDSEKLENHNSVSPLAYREANGKPETVWDFP